MMDERGNVWFTSRVGKPETPAFCQAGSDHPSAKLFPIKQSTRHLAFYDPIGTVKRFDDVSGFGFLETEDGREIYFHKNSLLDGGSRQVAPGTRVTFFEEMGDKGPQASTVKLLGKHGLR